jgi:hypothetical protein
MRAFAMTVKSLIGIAPNGSIVYVSDLFEGSISDRAIIEKSGFLDKINPGDLILADVENPLAFEQRTRCSQLYNEYF